jgi:glutathione S-transferase
MKLYSGPVSLFTAKVRIALVEKRLAYDRVEVDWSLANRYQPHHPDVVALNPKKQVPVLVDDDLTLYDSTVILEYLEDRYPDPPLYPSKPAARARCRQLEDAADEIVFPYVWEIIEEFLYPPAEGGRDPQRLAEARSGLDVQHAGLDKQLADGEHLCGAFTVADIATFIMIAAGASLGVPVDERHARLLAWLTRVSQRPSVVEEMQGMTRALAAARDDEG